MPNSVFVLDAFALIGFFKDEPGVADVMDDLFRRAHHGDVQLVAATVNAGELYYKTVREFGSHRARDLLAQFEDYAVQVIPVDWSLAFAGALIKSVHRISYADCIAAALAQRLDATLVTGDDGFRQISDLKIQWLPK
jgi:predicted nucleic acid-binding protein